MIAAAAGSGATWTSFGAAVVFLLALGALAVDRIRVTRRLRQLERSEALLETDLADARREIASLRDVLRDTTGRGGSSTLGSVRPGPSDPGASVS